MNMALHVYEDIMRMTENLSEKYIIGYGASSTVYKCVLKNCKPVAIKRLYSHYPHNLKEFETELETVGSIKHRNLVSLQGYSLSPFGNLLFYDYMENGSLWDLLHGTLASRNLPQLLMKFLLLEMPPVGCWRVLIFIYISKSFFKQSLTCPKETSCNVSPCVCMLVAGGKTIMSAVYACNNFSIGFSDSSKILCCCIVVLSDATSKFLESCFFSCYRPYKKEKAGMGCTTADCTWCSTRTGLPSPWLQSSHHPQGC